MLSAMLWLPRRGDFTLDMAQQLGIVSQLLVSEITMGETNLLLSEVRKQQLEGLSRRLGCPTLGPTKRKMGILPPRSGIQVHTQGVSLQDPTVFQADLGSLDLS